MAVFLPTSLIPSLWFFLMLWVFFGSVFVVSFGPTCLHFVAVVDDS